MASKYVFDVVATVGKYTGQDGTEKKNYLDVGKAFEDDQGRLSIKLSAIPVGPDWSGWLSLYEPKLKEQRPAPRQAPSRPAAGVRPETDTDDIPFSPNVI